MRRSFLTLLVLLGCQDKKTAPPLPPPPPHDGVTLIQPGAPPYQVLRYRLTKGAKAASELVCDFSVKTDDQTGPMPTLVVDLETTVEDVLADGSARLRVTVVGTAVRDRADSQAASELVRAEAAAMQGVVITETLAPDGMISDSRVATTAAAEPDKPRSQLDSLLRSLEHVAMRLPAEPVGAGATWRERKTLPEGGIRAVSEITYTLVSLTGSTVGYTSVGLSTGGPQTIEQDGMKVEVSNTRGHSEAKGTLDLSRYVLEITTASSFATAMNVVAPAGTPGAGSSSVEIAMAIQVSPTAARPAEPAAAEPDGPGAATPAKSAVAAPPAGKPASTAPSTAQATPAKSSTARRSGAKPSAKPATRTVDAEPPAAAPSSGDVGAADEVIEPPSDPIAPPGPGSAQGAHQAR